MKTSMGQREVSAAGKFICHAQNLHSARHSCKDGWRSIRRYLLDSLLLEPVGSNFSHFQKKKINIKVLSGNGVLFGSTLMNCSLELVEETFGNVISRLQEEQFFREESGESKHRGQQASLRSAAGCSSRLVFRKSLVICLFIYVFFTSYLGLFLCEVSRGPAGSPILQYT